MGDDDVRGGVGLDTKRAVGDQADLGSGRLLQFTVLAAMDIVLPDRDVALLRDRVGNRAGIRAAQRLELSICKSDAISTQ